MNSSRRKRPRRAATATAPASVGQDVSKDAGPMTAAEPTRLAGRRPAGGHRGRRLPSGPGQRLRRLGRRYQLPEQSLLPRLSAAQWKWAWTTFWVGVYQPLGWLLLEAEYVIWGFDPRGYHLVSLLLHVANAVVLYFLTVTLLSRSRTDTDPGDPWVRPLAAGVATALFAVHPLRVEAVAWASSQSYLPCALFFMLAVLAYLKAFGMSPRPGGAGWRVRSCCTRRRCCSRRRR